MFYRHLTAAQLRRFDGSLKTIIDVYGPRDSFVGDNLIALDRQFGFGGDQPFVQAYRAEAKTLLERALIWRFHVLCWAARHAVRLEGDFVECGVYRGTSCAIVARALRFETLDRRLWLYDLFDHSTRSSGKLMPGHGAGLAGEVAKRFRSYPNVTIVKGFVPDSFEQGVPERIAWFHLDLNDAVAETAALERLFDRITPGGLLILDDYGWRTYPGQKEAADRFAAARGHHILELPTGQGLLIKR